MINSSTIQGRLTADIELKTTGNGNTVCSFSVASNRGYKDKTTGETPCDYVDCVAWGNKAEFLAKNFSKGDMVVLSGRLQTRTYEDKSGNHRKATEINVNEIAFGGNKGGNNSAPQTTYSAPPTPSIDYEDGNSQEFDPNDEDLPF